MSAWWKRVVSMGPRTGPVLPLILAMVAAFGLLGWWSASRVLEDIRQDFLESTNLVTQALNVERVARLMNPLVPRTDVVGIRVRRQLIELQGSHPLSNDIHLLGQAANGSIYHVISDKDDLTHPEPFPFLDSGTRQQVLVERFRIGGRAIWGPWSDSVGTWMTTMQAVREARTGRIVALLAQRFDVENLQQQLIKEALPFLLAALSLLVIVLVAIYRPGMSRATAHGPSVLPFLFLLAGVVLTCLLSWELHHHESSARRVDFRNLAIQRAAGIVEKLRIVRETELESLVRFFSGSDHVTQLEFQQFSAFLTRNRMIHSWGWLQRVDTLSHARSPAPLLGGRMQESAIWEQDSLGRRRKASPRSFHLPVFGLAPDSGGAARVGFDFLSEPNRRRAVEEAMSTKIPVSTLPVAVSEEDSAMKVMYFLRPVFRDGDSSRLWGCAMAAMEPDAPLRSLDGDSLIHLDIVLLRADSTPLRLSSTSPHSVWDSSNSVIIPFLGFGRTFAVQARPTDHFHEMHPRRLAWIGLFAGTILTLGISLTLLVALRRRRELETMVSHQSEQLQETERSYRNQFAANTSVMLMVDPRDRMIVDANEAATRFYGYSRDQLLRMRISDLTLSTGEEFVSSTPNSEARGRRFEFQHILCDGQVRDVEVSSSFVQFGANTVLHAIVHDITDRKRIEQERQSLEQRLEWALAATGEGVWDWNVSTDTVKHNSRWCELLGLETSFHEHSLQAFLERIHPDDRQLVYERVQACLDGSGAYASNHRMIRLDGVTIHVEDRGDVVARSVDGSSLRMVGSMADVTERRCAEDALRESEAKRSLAMDFARMASWELDTERGVFLFDDKFYALYGTTAEAQGGYEMSMATYAERFLHPEEWAKVVSEIQSALRSDDPGFSNQIEHELKRPDGKQMYVSVQYGVVKDAASRTIRLFGANQDITERKLAELALRSMNESLEEATARANSLAAHAEMASVAKSEFLANMSHEIRTPMNGIIGMTGLLLDTELSNKQRRYAEIVRQSGESLLALLNDILDLSKIEAGKLELEELDFDLRNMLDDFGGLLAVRAAQKKLEFVCAADPRIPNMLRGDPGRLRQILLNLAGNAIKFTEAGEITVRAVLQDETDGLATIRFAVKDTGIGIPAEKIPDLFQKFTQVDASTTRRFGGTGLGLAISRQLVELMDGEIGIESQEGIGSEFWFTAVFEVRPSHESQDAEIAAVHGGHFLVVDDNATNREVLRTQIESWGGRVEDVGDAPAALMAMRRAREESDPFAAILVDRQMPGMDGIDLARAIRADAHLKDSNLILMPSITHQGDAQLVKTLGFTATLVKPARQSDLLDALSTTLGRTSSHMPPDWIETTEFVKPDFGSKRARILLAEDNVVNQMVATGILESFGLRVDVVANGMEALRALETLPYDLVLMDVQMPEMDGFEATRLIRDPRSNVRNREIPVIAMTANAMRGDREACLDAGMNDYVSKPVNPPDLAKALDAWLPDHPSIDDSISSSPETDLPEDPLASLPVFDRAALLERVMGSESLMKKVLASFQETIPAQIDAMGEYIERGEFGEAGKLAHGIKGAASNIAAEAIAGAASSVETICHEGDKPAALVAWSRLQDDYERWKAEVENT